MLDLRAVRHEDTPDPNTHRKTKTEMGDGADLALSRSLSRRKGIHVRRTFLINGTAVVCRGRVVGLDTG